MKIVKSSVQKHFSEDKMMEMLHDKILKWLVVLEPIIELLRSY